MTVLIDTSAWMEYLRRTGIVDLPPGARSS